MTTKVEGLFICPYNKSHMITPHKLPNHLVRCRQNNPELAENILICPYNQCHHVPKEELEQHFRVCKEYHNFQALSMRPSTCERLTHRTLQNLDMLEQEQWKYNSHRNNFSNPPKTDDPKLSEVQRQRNQDDLDEWFVE